MCIRDRYTSQAERDLTARTERKGILTAEVLSFGRLAHQFFAKNGLNRAVILGDVGKQMASVSYTHLDVYKRQA